MPRTTRDPVTYVLYVLTGLAGVGLIAYWTLFLDKRGAEPGEPPTETPPAAVERSPGTDAATAGGADQKPSSPTPRKARESRRYDRSQLLYVAPVDGPLKLDGALEESLWASAVVAGPLRHGGRSWWPVEATEVRFAWGPDALRFAIRCRAGASPARHQVPATTAPADFDTASNLPSDGVTIRLHSPERSSPVRIRVSSHGMVDGPEGITATHAWSGAAWVAEGRIPAEALDLEKLAPGDPMRVSIRRRRRDASAYWDGGESGRARLALLPPVRQARALRVESAPTIDGAPDEAIWKKAERVSGLFFPLADGRPPVSTEARLLWDAEALYLAVRCEEPERGDVVAEMERRDQNVTQEDSIEVFLGPTPFHARYIQLAVNTLGTRFDMRNMAADDGEDPSKWANDWNMPWEAEAGWSDEDTWTAEARIPFAPLLTRKPRAGDRLGFNLVRNRGKDQVALYHWSPTLRLSNHIPSRFGILTLAAGPSAGD